MIGIHTILFTDLVDSTQLNDAHGDATLARLWQAHDHGARQLMQAWRGREVARSDGFLVLFDAPPDAIGFALAYHALLAGLEIPVRARVGIHTGEVAIRENPPEDVARGAPACEIDGIALPVAARIMSMALGGQTLLSGGTRQRLGQPAPPSRLKDHGHWRLKGIAEPAAIFEIGEDNGPFEPPPDSDKAFCVIRSGDLWLPRRQIACNLPAERDTFVGRRGELHEIAARFEDGARLVSLLGIGGIGKTRLALHFAWTWLGSFDGGAWFCDLSQARSAEGITHALAKALDVRLAGADSQEQLAQALTGRGRCLIVLDNFEQVARHAGDTLSRWLDRAPAAAFMVTTREVLGVPGEQVVNLAPLDTDDSARLFILRAQAASQTFHLRKDEEPTVARLARLLDGLPLAIELAAVRVRVMTPGMLLERMSERFRLLAAGGTRRDRQATLRSTLDWSWDLLSLVERAALAQLSVFEGGFTLSAAEAVLDLPGDTTWPVDVVQALVEKSMVRQASPTRLELLQSVKEYAAERLAAGAIGTSAVSAVRARHGRHYAAFDEARILADSCADLDNLLSACRHALTAGDASSAVRALEVAWTALRMVGGFQVAMELVAQFDAAAPVAPADAAAVHWVAGSAAYLLGEVATAEFRFKAGLQNAVAAGARRIETQILCAHGELLMTAGRLTESAAALERAAALAASLGDQRLIGGAFNGLGSLASEQGRPDDAQRHFEQALTLVRQVGDRRWEGGLLSNLGTLHHGAGRLAEAEHHYEAALALAGSVGDRRWEGSARCNLALLQHDQGRHVQAREGLENALAIARLLGHRHLESTVLCNLGIVVEAIGEPEEARLHYEAAVRVAQALGERRAEGQFRGYLGLLYARHGEFGRARECLARGEELLDLGTDQLSLGLLLCSRAEVEALAGDGGAARATLARARQIGKEAGVDPATELGRAIAKAGAAMAAG